MLTVATRDGPDDHLNGCEGQSVCVSSCPTAETRAPDDRKNRRETRSWSSTSSPSQEISVTGLQASSCKSARRAHFGP